MPTRSKSSNREPPPGALLLTLAQAAYLLNVSAETLRGMIRHGQIIPVKLPHGGIRIERSEIETQVALWRAAS